MKAYLTRFFKHYATLLVFTLLVTNCERDPIVETTSNNDTNNALVFEALLETAKQKVKQYNVAVSQTSKTTMSRGTTAKAKQSFDAKYGRPVFNKTIRLTNHVRKPILIIPLTGRDNKVMNLLVGYEKEHIKTYKILTRRMGRGNVLYYNSNSAYACQDTFFGRAFIGGLFNAFNTIVKSKTSVTGYIDISGLADGCWVWDGSPGFDCFYSVDCDSIDTSGPGSSGPGTVSPGGATPSGNPSPGPGLGISNGSGGAGGGGIGGSNDNPSEICGDTPFDENLDVVKSCAGYQYYSSISKLSNAQIALISAYINVHGCMGENESFVKAAIEALVNDGEVDFNNELIFTNAFIQTKAFCVIKLLSSSNNNLFKDVTSQFTSNNSKNKLRFTHEPIIQSNGTNNTTTVANTSPPDSFGIITIRFNSNTNSANANSLEIASTILHEAIHAELFRIVLGNNDVPEPLPQYLYDYMVGLLEYFEENGSPDFINSSAQHSFMAYNYVEAIAKAIKNFDNNTHPLENYMSFGWEGLSQIGIATQPPLVTMQEINNYYALAQIPLTDNHKLACDE